jgi:hypothetical protein
MSHLLRWIDKEVHEAIPPVIFFFVAFNLINFTERIMLEKSGVTYTSFFGATIGAFVAWRELIEAVGSNHVGQLFFGGSWKP